MRNQHRMASAALLLLLAAPRAQDSLQVQYKGAGWLQAGRVQNSSDVTTNGVQNDFNGNWFENAGAQVAAVAKFSPEWEGALALGAIQTHHARGSFDVANNWYPYWGTFVGEARVTHTRPLSESMRLQFNLGFFNYNYNPDIKDLGLYLLRGMIYPGVIHGGFEARHTSPASNIFGALARFQAGGFTNDLLAISETETRPYFDISVADVATWQVHPAFQLGAGVNFYRLLPRNPGITNPKKGCNNEVNLYTQIAGTSSEVCIVLDTVMANGAVQRVDTVTGGLSGTKVMGRFRFDPKEALSLPAALGKQDLVLYSEVAVLGLENRAKYYEKMSERIPVMLGLNLPAFGYLDKLSLEVEWFGNKNYHDYGKTEIASSWVPRVVDPAVTNTSKDDLKWALYASKVVFGHLRLSGQVANDHLRTFGPPDIGYLTYAESLTTLKDWYWMGKITYFF